MSDKSSIPSKSRIIKKSPPSLASRWNIKLMRGLEAGLRKHPEADILSLLPQNYSQTLQSYKEQGAVYKATRTKVLQTVPDDDIRSRLSATDECTILVEFSAQLRSLICVYDDVPSGLLRLLAEGEVLYNSAWAGAVTVLKISPDIVVKITGGNPSETEIRTLTYLQEHLPAFPVPTPHGLARFGNCNLLFEQFLPGLDLEKAWPRLGHDDKCSISMQLDKLLCDLRSLPHMPELPFGGVGGEGCKDGRRGLRISTSRIMTTTEFEDFMFAGSKLASSLYLGFLRSLKPASPPRGVFTHGDIRPANIIVQQHEDLTWKVVGIIDWESSGFYPAHWECVKMTNNLSFVDQYDWYLHLPGSLCPRQYPTDWLVDRVLDRNLDNS